MVDEVAPFVEKLPPRGVGERVYGKAQFLRPFALTPAYSFRRRRALDKCDFAPVHPRGQARINKWSHSEC